MRRVLGCVLGLAVACQASPALSREPRRLKPIEPWNLHYADDSCRLARAFGVGDEQVVLVMDQFEPGDDLRMMFVGEGLRGRTDYDGSVRFGPNEKATDVTFSTGKVNRRRALIVNGTVRVGRLKRSESGKLDAPIGEAREAAATWLQLNDDLIFETGSMAKPLASLRDCSWATVKLWGLDVEQQKGLTRKPEPKRSPSRWFSSADYPSRMVKTANQGIVNFRMIVDASGKAVSCHIQESTHPKDFDDAVCAAAMKRATFEPALDAQGKPVTSYWRQTVHFVLE